MVLSNADLLARASKLQREQQARSAKAKAKLDAERLAQARVRQHKQALEEEKARVRAEQLRAQEEAEERRAAELERNNGVLYHAHLAAIPIAPDTAASRGIKRAADKIILPRSVESTLMAQEAYKNGAMQFQLMHPNGRVTHAAVLDFSGEEGTVGLPEKVVRCLWGVDCDPVQDCSGLLEVRYRRLHKGTYARLQPRSALFQSDAGEHIKDILEASLHLHSTLTEGDWLTVHGPSGTPWSLRVKELLPEGQVSVIDTDLEAQLDPSLETEERIAAEEEAARRHLEAVEALRREAEDAAQRAAADKARRDAQEAAHRAAVEIATHSFRQAKSDALPPEPPADTPHALTIATRMPDGSRHARRFLPTTPLSVVYDHVDAVGGGGVAPGGYRLVSAFPRVVYGMERGGEEVGVVFGDGERGGQVMLLVEPVGDKEGQ